MQVLGVGGSGNLFNIVWLATDLHGGSVIALKNNGTIYDWGRNDCHQQMGAVSGSSTPVQVTTYQDRVLTESSFLIYLSGGTPFVISTIYH